MGGDVQVQSSPGAGSVFTLTAWLPAAARPVHAAGAAPLHLASAGLVAHRDDGKPGTWVEVVPTGKGPVTPWPPPPLNALPTSLAESAAAVIGPRSAAGEPNSVSRCEVLLAEDNEVNVYLFEAMLEGLPLQISVAQDGLAALAMVRARRCDIAFFDVQMPGMDGLTLTRELRQIEAQSARPRTPVVALTANAFASDVQLSLQAGCDMHVAKPFDKARLHEALSSLLLRPLVPTARHPTPPTPQAPQPQ